MADPNQASAALPYECSWANFRTGFLDWWAEWSHPNTQTSRKRASPWWVVALVTWGFMLGAGLSLALLGPSIAGAMSLVGTRFIASLSLFLAAVLTAALLLGLPVYAGRKTWVFSKQMCHRGWELRTRQRKPWNSLGPASSR